MFDFLRSKDGKMRHQARRWVEMADRIHDFRRDLLTPVQLEALQTARADLKQKLKERASADIVHASVERLEKVLQQCGGRLYPANSMVENVEFFLVAAIVILGLRAYFVQPFKIPTNSMWPSYYGMTAEVFEPGQEPGALAQAGRLATLGARRYSVEAPADGEVYVATFPRNPFPAFVERPGRSMLIFPAKLHQYAFMVAGKQATLTVPAEFFSEMEKVFDASIGGPNKQIGANLAQASVKAGMNIEMSTWRFRNTGDPRDDMRVHWLPTGRTVKKGEKIVSFDILTGDLLFVDRLTYNFIPPSVGSGFVFKTGKIEGLRDELGDIYFVKRLIGLPGDTLEIRRDDSITSKRKKQPVDPKFGLLFRNGAPIAGAKAFERNAVQEGLYPGYRADGYLAFGDTLKVPEHSYFAMGDNSPNSRDGRSWGFIPEKDVVGRPLFIYYPLTKRWGPAH